MRLVLCPFNYLDLPSLLLISLHRSSCSPYSKIQIIVGSRHFIIILTTRLFNNTAIASMSGVSNNTTVVANARVVAHLSQDLGSGVSENHWSIYLLFENGGAIRMNMTADYGDPTGSIEWTTYNYQLTNSALHHWDYQMAEGVTVKHVYDLVYYYRRNQYFFSGGGSGCRYWW